MVSTLRNVFQRQRLSVPAASDGDHAGIIAKSRDVDAEHDRADLILAFPRDGVGHQVRADELQAAGARKDTPDANANEVAVLAVVIDPFGDLGLVGQLRVAAVDLAGDPAMPELAENSRNRPMFRVGLPQTKCIGSPSVMPPSRRRR